jgi:hypothetical protein
VGQSPADDLTKVPTQLPVSAGEIPATGRPPVMTRGGFWENLEDLHDLSEIAAQLSEVDDLHRLARADAVPRGEWRWDDHRGHPSAERGIPS